MEENFEEFTICSICFERFTYKGNHVPRRVDCCGKIACHFCLHSILLSTDDAKRCCPFCRTTFDHNKVTKLGICRMTLSFMERCCFICAKMTGERCSHCKKIVCSNCTQSHRDEICAQLAQCDAECSQYLNSIQDSLAKEANIETLEELHKSLILRLNELLQESRRRHQEIFLQRNRLCETLQDEIEVHRDKIKSLLFRLQVGEGIDALAELEAILSAARAAGENAISKSHEVDMIIEFKAETTLLRDFEKRLTCFQRPASDEQPAAAAAAAAAAAQEDVTLHSDLLSLQPKVVDTALMLREINEQVQHFLLDGNAAHCNDLYRFGGANNLADQILVAHRLIDNLCEKNDDDATDDDEDATDEDDFDDVRTSVEDSIQNQANETKFKGALDCDSESSSRIRRNSSDTVSTSSDVEQNVANSTNSADNREKRNHIRVAHNRGRGGPNMQNRGRGGQNVQDHTRGGFNMQNRGRGGQNVQDHTRGGFNMQNRGRGGQGVQNRGRGGPNVQNRGRGGPNAQDGGRGPLLQNFPKGPQYGQLETHDVSDFSGLERGSSNIRNLMDSTNTSTRYLSEPNMQDHSMSRFSGMEPASTGPPLPSSGRLVRGKLQSNQKNNDKQSQGNQGGNIPSDYSSMFCGSDDDY